MRPFLPIGPNAERAWALRWAAANRQAARVCEPTADTRSRLVLTARLWLAKVRAYTPAVLP